MHSLNGRESARHSLPALLLMLAFAPGALAQVPASPMPLSLPQAIDMALKQNRDLKLAHLAVADSLHKKEIARADYFPRISNESKVAHITELAGVEIPAGAFGNHPDTGLIPATTLFLDQGAATSYTSGTGLAQPFTQMFKIHAANRAASAEIGRAKAGVTSTENAVALRVRQIYSSILIAQLKQQAADEEVAASQVKVEEGVADVARGNALDVVVLQSRAAALSAKQQTLVERLEIHDLTVSLNDLLGLPLNTQLALQSDAAPEPLPARSREQCISTAQEHNPEIQRARLLVEKAKAGLAAAKDAYIPDITGLARYSYQSGIPFLVHNFGTFGFNVTWDVFDGGRREAEIRDRRTELAEAELELEKAKDEVAVQVEAAYSKVEQLRDLQDVAKQALQAREEAARVTEQRFSQNAALASARAEAKAQAISAQASLLEASLGLYLAEAGLRQTLGELPR
jgi:outer membrane protein TolC